MRWRVVPGQPFDLVIEEAAAEEREAATAALATFRDFDDTRAKTTGRRLLDGFDADRMAGVAVLALSRWCNTGHQYRHGSALAVEASQRLFNGGTIPRLDRISTDEARRLVRTFLIEVGAAAE